MKQTRLSWQRIYAIRLLALDSFVVVGVLALAQFFVASQRIHVIAPTSARIIFLLGLAGLWIVLLAATGSRNPSLFGVSPEEYRAVALATFQWIAGAALFAVILNADVSFLFLLGSAILGGFTLLLARRQLRKWLTRKRVHGRYFSAKVVVWGAADQREIVTRQILAVPEYGFAVVGMGGPDEAKPEFATGDVRIDELPFHATSDPVAALRASDGDTLALAGDRFVTPQLLKEVSWKLKPSENLMLVDELLDVAGPRLSQHHLPNLALTLVKPPTFHGASRLSKRWLDLLVSGAMLIAFALPMLFVAAIIRLDSPGPALFKQTRIGLGGQPFTIYKFRTMRVGAEGDLMKVLEQQGKQMGLFYKIQDDPRITKLGRFLRKTSIDELPQLFNVFAGQMSLVGPRPQVPAEVELYDSQSARRLLVKPGLSGLWQVDGRSNLTPEQGIRKDLYYVENWSMTQDLMILWRTIGSVLVRRGAK